MAIIKHEPWPKPPTSPHEDGFLFGWRKTALAEEGQLFSRIGNLDGTYVAPRGSSLSARGLPSTYPNTTETLWQVFKPFKWEAGLAAPWKDATGLGIQWKLPESINQLEKAKFIRPYLGP